METTANQSWWKAYADAHDLNLSLSCLWLSLAPPPPPPSPSSWSYSENKSKLAPVAKTSLYGIIRQHCREELIINPVRWTARHLELLQCSFEQLLPEPLTPAKFAVTQNDYDAQFSGTPHLHEFFHYYYKVLCREQGIRLLLTSDGCPLGAYDAIYMYFDGYVIKRLECVSLCLKHSLGLGYRHERPVVAFIDRGHIEMKRQESIGYRNMYYNPPMLRLFNKRWKKTCPPVPVYDPYIVALLISVAQQKRRHFQEIYCDKEISSGKIFSQVLSSFYSKGECNIKGEEAYMGWLYLYQANIPLSFLDMFDNPRLAPSGPPAFSVQIVQIRYSPLATLRARILELIMPEKLVSETYGPPTGGIKRKHEDEGETQPSLQQFPAEWDP
ncbi:hypothetical protein V8C35DRAFT_291416 [Trichoderma chlorosporum]